MAASHPLCELLKLSAKGSCGEGCSSVHEVQREYFPKWSDLKPSLGPPLSACRGKAQTNFSRWTRKKKQEPSSDLTVMSPEAHGRLAFAGDKWARRQQHILSYDASSGPQTRLHSFKRVFVKKTLLSACFKTTRSWGLLIGQCDECHPGCQPGVSLQHTGDDKESARKWRMRKHPGMNEDSGINRAVSGELPDARCCWTIMFTAKSREQGGLEVLRLVTGETPVLRWAAESWAWVQVVRSWSQRGVVGRTLWAVGGANWEEPDKKDKTSQKGLNERWWGSDAGQWHGRSWWRRQWQERAIWRDPVCLRDGEGRSRMEWQLLTGLPWCYHLQLGRQERAGQRERKWVQFGTCWK